MGVSRCKLDICIHILHVYCCEGSTLAGPLRMGVSTKTGRQQKPIDMAGKMDSKIGIFVFCGLYFVTWYSYVWSRPSFVCRLSIMFCLIIHIGRSWSI